MGHVSGPLAVGPDCTSLRAPYDTTPGSFDLNPNLRRYLPGNISEPNNLQGSENCAAANYTQNKMAQDIQTASNTFNGTGALSNAWAWADAR